MEPSCPSDGEGHEPGLMGSRFRQQRCSNTVFLFCFGFTQLLHSEYLSHPGETHSIL